MKRTPGAWCRGPIAAAGIALVLAAGLAAGDAGAHGRTLSYSRWEIAPDGSGARVSARITALDATRLDPATAREPGGSAAGSPPAEHIVAPEGTAEHLAARLVLLAGGRPCPPVAAPSPVPASTGWVEFRWEVRCAPPVPGDLVIRSLVLQPEVPTHLHFARARIDGGEVTEKLLAEGDDSWRLAGGEGEGDAPRAAADDAGGSPFLRYVALGVEHILSGWDHLAFLLALLLLADGVAELASLVTAFTLAHSVTLALAVLGLVRPEAAAIEAVIGLSIALVAAENTWLLGGRGRAVPLATAGALGAAAAVAALRPAAVPAVALLGLGVFALCHFALLTRSPHPGRLRAAVAFAFGLVHGFGFAGALAEMELPARRLVAALVGFNVGVELGQLAVVTIAWPLLRLLGRTLGRDGDGLLGEALSAGVCGIGLYWFVTRTFG